MIDKGQIFVDSAVRNWLLFPLVFVMFCFLCVRHYLGRFFSLENKIDPQNIELILRLQSVKALKNASFLPSKSFNKRFEELAHPRTGFLTQFTKNAELEKALNSALARQNIVQHLVNILPNFLLLSLVSNIFSQVVIARIPFALPENLRPLLQHGVDLPALDVSYATSLSMYFLLFFGLRGVVGLYLDETSVSENPHPLSMEGLMRGGNAQFSTKQALEQVHLLKSQYTCRIKEGPMLLAELLRTEFLD